MFTYSVRKDIRVWGPLGMTSLLLYLFRFRLFVSDVFVVVAPLHLLNMMLVSEGHYM